MCWSATTDPAALGGARLGSRLCQHRPKSSTRMAPRSRSDTEMGRSAKSTQSESFKFLVVTKTLNGCTFRQKTRAPLAQASSSPLKPRLKEWSHLRPGTSDADRLDK